MLYHKTFPAGKISEDWKSTNVTPIFKKDNRSEAENYRPISGKTDIRSTRECRSLSEKFEAYFVEKIRKIKTAIKQWSVNSKADPLQPDQAYSGAPLLHCCHYQLKK
jgi:hypothetical protein